MAESAPQPLPDPARVQEFISLYSSHQRRLYLYVTTLLPGSFDIDDVLQETNLVLWKKFSSYQTGTNFMAWACQITRYEVLKYRERQERNLPQLDPQVLEVLADEIPRAQDVEPLLRRTLSECLNSLSAADRDLILLRYTASESVQNIAARSGRSANALSKSLGRIRRLLLSCIESKLAQELGDAP